MLQGPTGHRSLRIQTLPHVGVGIFGGVIGRNQKLGWITQRILRPVSREPIKQTIEPVLGHLPAMHIPQSFQTLCIGDLFGIFESAAHLSGVF